jgi:hypothetical protein
VARRQRSTPFARVASSPLQRRSPVPDGCVSGGRDLGRGGGPIGNRPQVGNLPYYGTRPRFLVRRFAGGSGDDSKREQFRDGRAPVCRRFRPAAATSAAVRVQTGEPNSLSGIPARTLIGRLLEGLLQIKPGQKVTAKKAGHSEVHHYRISERCSRIAAERPGNQRRGLFKSGDQRA